VSLPPEESGETGTQVLGDDDEATRRLDETAATQYRPAPAPSRRPTPRVAQRHAPASPPAAAPPTGRGAFSRFARFVLATVALVLIAGAVAAAVIFATDSASGVDAREVAGDTVDRVVEEFKELVERNTE
jgi:hypothetical protein